MDIGKQKVEIGMRNDDGDPDRRRVKGFCGWETNRKIAKSKAPHANPA